MKRNLVPVFIFTSCFLILNVCTESVEMVSSEANVDNSDVLTLDEIRENNSDRKKGLNVEFNKFYSEKPVKCQNSIDVDKLAKIIDNYIQRYISLFLITSNLLNYNVKSVNEDITVDLEISILGDDLIYLQEYSKNSKGSSYLRSLSKLDAIFSKIARLKKESYMENIMKSPWSFFNNFNFFSVYNSHPFSHFLPFLIISCITWIVYHYIIVKYFWGCVGILMNSMILWESIQLYWRKIKEADIELYVNNLQSKNMPEYCNLANVRWYHSVVNFFFGNKCLQYYKNVIKNPIEEVSLLKCIIDTYSYYLFQTPLRIFGASIRDFTGEISDLWPWPFKYLVNIPVASFFGVVLLVVILILCGKRFKVSFFGASLEIGDTKIVTQKENHSAIDNEVSKREPIRVFQKLRPWTKTRFPKRLDVDLGKKRKLLLKPSKSVVEVVEDKNKQNFGDSNESACSHSIKHE